MVKRRVVLKTHLWPQQTDGLTSGSPQHRTDGWRFHPPPRWTRGFREQLCSQINSKSRVGVLVTAGTAHTSCMKKHFPVWKSAGIVSDTAFSLHSVGHALFSSYIWTETELPVWFRVSSCQTTAEESTTAPLSVWKVNTLLYYDITLNIKSGAVADWLLFIFTRMWDSGMRCCHRGWWWTLARGKYMLSGCSEKSSAVTLKSCPALEHIWSWSPDSVLVATSDQNSGSVQSPISWLFIVPLLAFNIQPKFAIFWPLAGLYTHISLSYGV